MSTNRIKRVTLTEMEFCKRVGISRDTARKYRDKGLLPHCKIGRHISYLPRHIDEFLANVEENKRTQVNQ